MTAHDKRLHAVRPDLADERLRGKVASAQFVAGRSAWIVSPVVDVLQEPSPDAGLSTQLQLGEEVKVFEEAGGWAWVQGTFDGYVGYIDAACIGDAAVGATHTVRVPRTFIYSAPDLKLARRASLSMGALVKIVGFTEARGTRYAITSAQEAIIADHVTLLEAHEVDFVSVAETLTSTPYLWGGSTAFGIDCSGLVQLSMRMTGRQVLRDTDMQVETVGEPVAPGAKMSSLRRGDLVFWRGHVAIMTDSETIIHANGHTMMVNTERLTDAISRIGYLYGAPVSYRRPNTGHADDI